jgi:hypothetical protein
MSLSRRFWLFLVFQASFYACVCLQEQGQSRRRHPPGLNEIKEKKFETCSYRLMIVRMHGGAVFSRLSLVMDTSRQTHTQTLSNFSRLLQ